VPHSAETTDALSDGLRSDLNATKAFYEQKLKLAERQREEADKVHLSGLWRLAVGALSLKADGTGRPLGSQAGLGCDALRRPMRQYNPAASPCGPIAACVARTLHSCIPHSIVMRRCSIVCCFVQLYVASLRSPLVQRQVTEAFRSREAAEWERRTEEVTPCVRACACAHAGVRARARSSSGMGWERNAFCAFARTCV
jgi:hypothetical protein